MDIIPYSDLVILKKIELEAKSAGGIILSEIEKERETNYGVVLRVGPGKQIDTSGRMEIMTKEGDIVAFPDSITQVRRFTYFGENFYHVRETDILFKIGEEDLKRFTIKEYQTEGYEFDKNVKRM